MGHEHGLAMRLARSFISFTFLTEPCVLISSFLLVPVKTVARVRERERLTVDIVTRLILSFMLFFSVVELFGSRFADCFRTFNTVHIGCVILAELALGYYNFWRSRGN